MGGGLQWLSHNHTTIKIQKIAEALVKNKTKDLFSVASIIKDHNNVLPTSVNHASTDDDSVNLFADKYSNLYKSVNMIKVKLMVQKV